MKSLLVFVAVALACGASACTMDASHASGGSGGVDSPSGGSAASGSTGTVGAQLVLPAGQAIEVVSWQVSGPNGGVNVVQSGAVPVGNTRTASFDVGNLPAAVGYRIALSGTAVDGSVVCSGSASFDIVARQTTPVSVQLACAVAQSGSQVTLVSGQSFNCAGLVNVSASPVEAFVGAAVSLSAVASGPVSNALTYSWSAPSGTIGSPNSANTTFTCTVPGTVPVTIAAGDGPVPAGASCNATLSTRTISILCDPQQQPPPIPAMPGGVVATLMLWLGMAGVGSLLARRRRSDESAG